VPSDAQSVIAGRYELHDVVGHGRGGTVHRARDVRLLRTVAVRVVPLEDGDDLRGLLNAIQQMAAVTGHRHIVGLYDALLPAPDSLPSAAFLVMEFVDGPSLADCLDAPTDPVLMRRLGVELSEALDHLHSLGISHGDIGPTSVLINPDGHAKLTFSGRAGADPADDVAALNLMLRGLAAMPGASGPRARLRHRAPVRRRWSLAVAGAAIAAGLGIGLWHMVDRDTPVATTPAGPVATAPAS
jgi:serine/threonine protein kinase